MVRLDQRLVSRGGCGGNTASALGHNLRGNGDLGWISGYRQRLSTIFKHVSSIQRLTANFLRVQIQASALEGRIYAPSLQNIL